MPSITASGCPPRWRSNVEIPKGTRSVGAANTKPRSGCGGGCWLIVPLTLALIVLLIRVNTQSLGEDRNRDAGRAFLAVGAVWTLYLLGYHMSTAVWVGMIALMGVDAQTGVFMLLYLDLAYETARRTGRLRSLADLRQAVLEGAAKRIRPKFMTVATMTIGLVPIFWSTGAGADLMKRIAAPMAGGMTTSFLMELLVYPVLYMIWRQREISYDNALPSDCAGYGRRPGKPGARVAESTRALPLTVIELPQYRYLARSVCRTQTGRVQARYSDPRSSSPPARRSSATSCRPSSDRPRPCGPAPWETAGRFCTSPQSPRIFDRLGVFRTPRDSR